MIVAFGFQELDLKCAYLIEGFYAGDKRGGFTKCFEEEVFKKAGIVFHLSETFLSVSMKNVVRGLHFQFSNPQAKLVSVIAGRAWDVVVDLRAGSPTFRQWRAFELGGDSRLALYVPRGFAHGFASLEDGTIMLYQCDGAYNPETDSGILFNEPEIGIEWPVDERNAIHSQRDLKLLKWSEYARYVREHGEKVFGG